MNENMGGLVFHITSAEGTVPVENATTVVTGTDTAGRWVLTSDSSGNTNQIEISAPDKSLSLNPASTSLPYAIYNARITAEGFIPITINGIEIYEGIVSISEVDMEPLPKDRTGFGVVYNIPQTTVNTVSEEERRINLEEEPPLGPESDIALDGQPPRIMPRLLRQVVIPTELTVHLGAPNNASASNLKVKFTDYVKNVASSEIYPTWPDSSLRSNILAQISFVLNRVFTEWYRSRGYNFDITNNTAYDQYFVPGRNIYGNISEIVDEIFNNYVVKENFINPYFTEYCSGTTVSCDGLSQWGTVSLAERGYSPLGILQYYYGNDVRVTSSNNIQAIKSSYPGTALRIGTRNSDVKIIQSYLNRIAKNYPAIPTVVEDGVFNENTRNAVVTFQRIFSLTPDGVVGRATWNKISYIYAAIIKIAELGGEGVTIENAPPSSLLSVGSRGPQVKEAQDMLRKISIDFPTIPEIVADGIFGERTREAVIAFQKYFGLTPDGIIGRNTWNMLYDVFLSSARQEGFNVEYPGTLLRIGSRGDNVWLIQSYLAKISEVMNIPTIAVDGIFGSKTNNAVRAFQQIEGLLVDGIIGPQTWDRIVAVRSAL